MILLSWCKRYSICLIPLFNFYGLFPAFICADNIEKLVNNLFGLKILILLFLYNSVFHFSTKDHNYVLRNNLPDSYLDPISFLLTSDKR